MSSMLEQAIVDATALKEAAVKNAESIIIEKYSEDIKEVVANLLEQDEEEPPEAEDPFGGMEDFDADEEEPGGAEVEDQVPAAHSVGDPSVEQVDAVRDAVETAEDALDNVNIKLDDLEMTAKGGTEEGEVEIDLKQLRADLGDADDEQEELQSDDLIDREQIELEESVLQAMAEELTVDVGTEKTGWLNAPTSVHDHAEEQALAREEDTQVAEENEELKGAVEKLQKENTQLESKMELADERGKQLEQTILQLKDKFDEINLSNARLLYTNKVLDSTSLNERQKNKIVEAITKAENIEEARVIYETLQSATGASPTKVGTPQSLSEVVNNKNTSSLLLSRNRRDEASSHNFSDRMKRLAGIS